MLKTLLILTLGLLTAWSSRAAEPERSVIQITTFSQLPVWEAPWRFESIRRVGGSGFVIKGKRIMTNAHVVSWARQIIVRRYQDPRPYQAEVEFVGHDCDLAVLKVADEGFFEKVEPLEFGDLPKVRSGVVTCGYPAGGEEISYTRGVVSRIELQPYTHIGNRQLLTVQTDAAINPGNSGGPVFQEDRVVGVAFQGQPGLENAGFFIPPTVIHHFLKDIEDGKYDGFPHAGIRVMSLQNPAYREYLKVPENNLGARVDGILPIPATQKVLKMDDVLLKVGEFPIASDGTILYEGNRVSAALGLQFGQNGETVPIEVWRDGRQEKVELPLTVYEGDRAAGYQSDTPPRYYVYGGLVFVPLSLDFLRTLGRNTSDTTVSEFYYELFYRRYESPETTRPEPIVLGSILADEINANFGVRGLALVDRINGVRIEKLEDAVRAFETSTNAYDYIEFQPHGTFECLDRAQVAKANPSILKNYGVTNDRRL